MMNDLFVSDVEADEAPVAASDKEIIALSEAAQELKEENDEQVRDISERSKEIATMFITNRVLKISRKRRARPLRVKVMRSK